MSQPVPNIRFGPEVAGFSPSQPQPTQPQAAHVLESYIWNVSIYVFPVQ